MRSLAIVFGAGLLAATFVTAQEVQRFTGDIGGGFTTPINAAGRNLDNGWNVGAGVGMNFNSYLGAMVQFQFNDLGINSSTLANIGVPGGNVNISSFTLDPRIHLIPKSHFDIYLVGGGGLYHRYQQFTAPTVATVIGFDPFFGFSPIAVPANTVLASSSVNRPGFNAGAGIAFGTKWHAKVFAEARYNRMLISSGPDNTFIPVTFGITF